MKMKKTILLALLSLFAVNLAQAQIKHTTMLETTRDTLHPEIVIDLWVSYQHLSHPTYPATGLSCIVWGTFCTFERYSQYLWEVDEQFLFEPDANLTDSLVDCSFDHPGYIQIHGKKHRNVHCSIATVLCCIPD